jgi:hypothetical protein
VLSARSELLTMGKAHKPDDSECYGPSSSIFKISAIHELNVGLLPSILAMFAYPYLCGLVVRVPGYRSRGPGPIPGAAIFYEK